MRKYQGGNSNNAIIEDKTLLRELLAIYQSYLPNNYED